MNKVFQILDVGSCHNPLKRCLCDNEFKITALDLNPGNDEVIKADFLQIPIDDDSNQECFSLNSNSYHAVIFCLLLEYLPSPKLRHKAIQRAIRLLQPYGLLVIATPDSSHEGKNMNQMKSWRLALAKMGLLRIYIEKLKHVHCIAFVKVEPKSDFAVVFDKEIQQIENKLDPMYQLEAESAFFIPQD